MQTYTSYVPSDSGGNMTAFVDCPDVCGIPRDAEGAEHDDELEKANKP